MGVPSVFLRTYGCNFKCAGFGMPKGELSDEREKVSPEDYKEYGTLPLVTTGCDSYASWDPRFKHLSPSRDTDTIVSDIMELLPFKEWKEEQNRWTIVTNRLKKKNLVMWDPSKEA